ncbi:MAG: Acetyl-CoA synthetase (ADP-forming), alpha and beta subunit fusion [Parcubacteria group bacterium GW2011_GWA2_43_11]|nr:MAG: Acetyl-CoA synthetase (ADP-forming), alpha and beta subunit fusion [Parcubacteria group bacterium GW2011_GWC2_42_11]KKS85949.1 MAG: Acetyl-CoA synthetase (ADP-forming), alpha and beta subunit fusion [Parcubacteria group bacterium GW2011_GWA2_43_11]
MINLHTLFNPNKVAVIGATNDESKVGYALMKNILAGSVREVYPVTLSETEVFGHVAYTSVKIIPGDVDLAVIAVRADIVASILEECAEKGIHSAIVISAGFKEMGEGGKKLEEGIAEIAHKHDITLLGPNCLGIMNAHADWNASFAVGKPSKGSTAFVSQSGALGTALLDWANKEGVGFSKFVSLGNEASLTELEFLEYLIDDEDTKAVLLYIEKVSDGPRFLELARRLAKKKPLVVLRAGRSTRGSAAVASHTGSLAPSDKVFGAALAQVGAIPVDSLRTLFSLSKLLKLGLTTKELQRIAIVTNGGGPSVNTADLIGLSNSLSLVTFSDETKEALRSVLPPMAAVGNPVDVIGDAGPSRYKDVLNILSDIPEVDIIIALVTPQMMTDPAGIAEVLISEHAKKPIIPVFMGGATVEAGIDILKQAGMVSFDSPTDAVESLDALARHSAKVPDSTPPTPRLSTHLSMLSFEGMQAILREYDMSLEGVFVKNKEELSKAITKLGTGPYAMKAISMQLVHKSDLQAVKLRLANAEALLHAWDDIETYVGKHTEGAIIDGMLIQPMIKGVECIVGMKRDPIFGPTIVFGLGGIFVEILKDSSIRIAPVTVEEALKQIQEIHGLPLLTGARGSVPVDLQALAEVIAYLSKLSLEHKEIEEIDFNPVFATATGARIVDARIMVK